MGNYISEQGYFETVQHLLVLLSQLDSKTFRIRYNYLGFDKQITVNHRKLKRFTNASSTLEPQ